MSDDEGIARVRIKQQHRTTCHQSAQLPKTAVGPGAVFSLGMVGAAPVSDHKHWIDVNDGSVLGNTKKDIRFLDRKIYGCPFYLSKKDIRFLDRKIYGCPFFIFQGQS